MMYDPFQPFEWKLAHGRTLTLGPKGLLMAIINVTPDSFSDGGVYNDAEAAVAQGLRCVEDGAAILDIGGESTRPGAAAVTAEEERARVLPVIKALAERTDAILSVDTYRAETARLAVAAGAHIINDVHGLQREPDLARVAAETGAGLCIMHTGRDREKLSDVVRDQYHFLDRSLEIAAAAGIERERIVLDPGFGFAKDTDENVELMTRFAELHGSELPLLAGTSRKRFIGAVTGREAQGRDVGTAATTALLRMAGAALFRVHDVAINRDALLVADAMLTVKRQAADGPEKHGMEIQP
ncbi:dihydropteroate synthase [Pararhizobium sp. BT-229]|uniref:dihydropteroate synthase n=1 Tax=Pararhizobium sp. BT-229 TaxID=2986923 RepID=UPI0021F74160|nr:dihydropteroate synthase [Pararhizobium sp. BT-229]MCV9960581.1 dihydropteroate synthase [Pararhizobium sp. BT-229]